MDLDAGERHSRPSSRAEGNSTMVAVAMAASREEDKEEDGIVENRDGAMESVVVA
jgi:hypothetical protein